ncbi:unnamed protein product [Orchesella dallaii]|uniref:Uncharacterized protein n=1 Tax=Orchesella dallaii TaxID=48710 RepID=A0ABP1PQS1_9HEXA
MENWDHFRQSFSLSILFALVFQGPVSATSICSNSFRFDQLCPDPRLGSTRDSGNNRGHTLDTNINLDSRHVGNPAYNGYASPMSTKEPSMTSCDFHRNGMETAVVTAVHMTLNPLDFRHANACTHMVKFSHEPYVSGGKTDSGRNGNSNWSSNTRTGGGTSRKGIKVCEKEIGIRRYSDTVHVDSHELSEHEEVMNKISVYFWHNFTLNSHSANFVDVITNYHLSQEDIACPTAPAYVQIATVVSKSGRCEIILQQYKIEQTRSPHGCGNTKQQIPYPIQFCGSYECSQINTIITDLKLISRRDTNQEDQDWNVYKPKSTSSVKREGSGGNISKPKGNSNQHKHRHNTEGQEKDKNRNEYDEDGSTRVPDYDQDQHLPPCKPEEEDKEKEKQAETTVITHEDEEKESGPIDWREPIFLLAFPIIGIIFILLILNILRSRSSKLEICRGYPIPRHSQSVYEGSFNSIEKNALPM